MIATVSEIKTILGISDSSKDTQLAALIPIVESDVFTYTNNYFKTGDKLAGDYTITVVSTTYKINDADSLMNDGTLIAGDKFYLSGSRRNDGTYTVSGIADGYVQTTEALIADSTEKAMVLYRVVYPAALKATVAKMCSYHMTQANTGGATSESIGNYSISYGGVSSSSFYPSDIVAALDRFKLLKTSMGSIFTEADDKRGVIQ